MRILRLFESLESRLRTPRHRLNPTGIVGHTSIGRYIALIPMISTGTWTTHSIYIVLFRVTQGCAALSNTNTSPFFFYAVLGQTTPFDRRQKYNDRFSKTASTRSSRFTGRIEAIHRPLPPIPLVQKSCRYKSSFPNHHQAFNFCRATEPLRGSSIP